MRCRRQSARVFGAFGQEFQSLSAQSAGFHARFAELLSSGGAAYAGAEAANANPLQILEQDLLDGDQRA